MGRSPRLVLPVALLLAAPAGAQLVGVQTTTIPATDAQVGGPDYDYEVSRFEVSNAEYATFLNDAELHNEGQNPGNGDERGDNLAFRQPPFGGDVGLVTGDSGDVDAVFDISRSLLLYDDGQPVGSRFSVVAGKADHAVVGVSWIGAVKFCNWLTIDHGLGLGQRCYAEGPSELDWFPVTIGDEIGGTQQATNQQRDLNDAERLALVRDLRGFRMPMDQGGTAVGTVDAVARPYNEWFKAAAFDPAAPDVPRVAFPGTFEEHTVPADHWIHGYGRDPLANADANFRSSGDPFDDPDPAVIATTPVGYYDGSDHGGTFQTTASANRYGLFDVSGNVWELLTDQVTTTDSLTPDRALVGGSYRSNVRQVCCANRGDIGPGTTRPVVGFRVMRVAVPPEPGTPFCFGVGCPCGNDDPPPSTGGCANSSGSGAVLSASGSTSVAADDLTLTVSNIPSPNANGIFFHGPSILPPFVPTSADGQACTGGGFRYAGILDDNVPPNVMSMTGLVAASGAGGVPIVSGQTVHFQGWTRDNNGSPCGGASNLSNAYSVTFMP